MSIVEACHIDSDPERDEKMHIQIQIQSRSPTISHVVGVMRMSPRLHI